MPRHTHYPIAPARVPAIREGYPPMNRHQGSGPDLSGPQTALGPQQREGDHIAD